MVDGHDGGSPRRAWWLDSLNPVENLQALADVQRFGRRTAERIADRMVAASEDGADEEGDYDLGALSRRFRADTARITDLWADLVDRAVEVVSTLASRAAGAAAEQDRTDRELLLGPIAPGQTATAVFWVHNPTSIPVPTVTAHCAPLRSHLCHELAPSSISFDPPSFDTLPARSSCGVEITVTVPAEAAPAAYGTMVFLSNVPDFSLPLTVAVVPEPLG
jgi:hypothetical protein